MTKRVWRSTLVAALAALGGLSGCGKAATAIGNHIPVSYKLDKPCLRQGERQGLATHTVTGANVAYAILYSDRNIHGTPPKGDTDQNGNFKATWTVPDNAPLGPADVRILAVAGAKIGPSTVVPFKVVERGKTCP